MREYFAQPDIICDALIFTMSLSFSVGNTIALFD